MIGARTDFTLTARLETPMHIGTGEAVAMQGPDKDDDKVQVAQVHVDFEGFPMIPGASIKGVLAHLLGQNLELFGGERAADDLISGKVIFWAGEMDRATCQANGPYHDETIPGTNHKLAARSLFVETNTAIDQKNGVVQAGRLFHKQMVAPGTCFTLSLSVAGGLDKDLLADLLGQLCAQGGICLGKGTKTSNGQLLIDPQSLKASTLGVDGTRVDTSKHWQALLMGSEPTLQKELATLTMISNGPYISADPSYQRDRGSTSEPHMVARADHHDRPLLTGASLLGSLRAGFAGWLAKSGGDGTDDPDATCKSLNEARALPPVQRIFGVTGWKGLITLGTIASIGENTRQKITSVKIDRFSNAPIDNALFVTEAWVAPAFKVALCLDKNRATTEDEQLVAAYLRSLTDPIFGGLQLGHGTNKGFGWFNIKLDGSVG